MVLFDLVLQIESLNIKEIFVSDPLNYNWYMTIKCSSCSETHKNIIYFSQSDQKQIKGQASHANFTFKCNNCNRQSSISFKISQSSPKISIQQSNAITKGVLATFDVRGCQPISFEGLNNLSVRGQFDQFENVDLSDIWCVFEERSMKQLMVEKVRAQFMRCKK